MVFADFGRLDCFFLHALFLVLLIEVFYNMNLIWIKKLSIKIFQDFPHSGKPCPYKPNEYFHHMLPTTFCYNTLLLFNEILFWKHTINNIKEAYITALSSIFNINKCLQNFLSNIFTDKVQSQCIKFNFFCKVLLTANIDSPC